MSTNPKGLYEAVRVEAVEVDVRIGIFVATVDEDYVIVCLAIDRQGAISFQMQLSVKCVSSHGQAKVLLLVFADCFSCLLHDGNFLCTSLAKPALQASEPLRVLHDDWTDARRVGCPRGYRASLLLYFGF